MFHSGPVCLVKPGVCFFYDSRDIRTKGGLGQLEVLERKLTGLIVKVMVSPMMVYNTSKNRGWMSYLICVISTL